MITNVNEHLSDEKLKTLVRRESENFRECYRWLEHSMPPTFLNEIGLENSMLITHSLMGFHTQDYFCMINLKNAAIVLCLDSADADLKILKNYALYGIQHYRTYVSLCPPSFANTTSKLRVAVLHFTGSADDDQGIVPKVIVDEVRPLIKRRNPQVTDEELDRIIPALGNRFIKSMPPERLILTLDMFFRTQFRDHCQYEVLYHDDITTAKNASMHIVLAWKNTPKHHFLYLLARTVHRHGLVMKGVNAAYIQQNNHQGNCLVMSIGLHGIDGRDAWEAADIPDFIREFITVKYFSRFDLIEEKLVRLGFVSGSKGNLLRAMVNFIHQALVNIDPNVYTIEHIEWDLCRLPDLTKKICHAFALKFKPNFSDIKKFNKLRKEIIHDIERLDTGNEENDLRRKNVLLQALNFINYTLKTNFYRYNYSALSFRLDPAYLDDIPFDRKKFFPDLPYGIFYLKGMNYFGFHIRFEDLARGGLRTVFPEYSEKMQYECDHVFSECYQLAHTQHKKNKEIPEGGSKGILFLEPHERIERELEILKKELESSDIEEQELKLRLKKFQKGQKTEFMYQAQRSFIINLLTIVNYDQNHDLVANHIVDYWKRAENIYLGPDENMHASTLDWIAKFSKRKKYRPGSSFITSKPVIGINHKEYGVTSSGVNVYMTEVLKYLGINPEKDNFTIKMTGGPDGDVAGNQILNLHKFYPKTAKLMALTDGTGTIFDPEGLDLDILVQLFHETKGIHKYPPSLLHEGGFLVDKFTKRKQTTVTQQTLCWRKNSGEVVEDWLPSSEMNHLLRNNVHHIITDIFIPAGGRPRTLNETNFTDYLDSNGQPTSKAIVEGANLYLSQKARSQLEERGVLIVRDSSANKAGVICSSYEVLCGLAIPDEEFIQHKEQLVKEIMFRVQKLALDEATLLLKTHKETGQPLTEISEQISDRINEYKYEILKCIEHHPLMEDPDHPFITTYLNYCPPTLKNCYLKNLLERVPDYHKKAIIACHMATELVYERGLDWSPTIVDVLPILQS
ncbi:MAG: NAD-specific glutamate dehydrogenase [Chlamydiae bacterium]|nr:NAD-specific glutamate dehydrogenase [Chlamydiota bacterium]